jgi:type IV secretory pathway VirB2 component (pilin)
MIGQTIALLVDNSGLPKASPNSFANAINIVLAVMGALAVLMIVIAGLRYTLSGSNAETVASARRQIIYSVVGLIVIALAASIVNFVVSRT